MTVADEVANQSQRWIIMLMIDGVGYDHSQSPGTDSPDGPSGSADGRWRICSSIPSYVAGGYWNTYYHPILMGPPEELSLRADQYGGMPDTGGISFSLLDHDDVLTENLRIESKPITTLSADITSSATSISVNTNSSVAQLTSPIWIGSEAIELTSHSGTTVTARTRGFLGTDAAAQKNGTEVFQYCPFLRGRFVYMYIMPMDASAETEAKLMGTWMIDGISYDPDLNVWNFNASSAMSQLGRAIPAKEVGSGKLLVGDDDTRRRDGRLKVEPGTSTIETQWGSAIVTAGDETLSVSDIIFSTNWKTMRGKSVNLGMYTRRRAIGGSKREELTKGTVLKQILLADELLDECSFRFSPGSSPATARTSGTWERSSHFVDILLCLMTSGRDSDLVGSNYSSTYGNWASLPTGFGAGIDIDKIDVQGFIAVKERTEDYILPFFSVGQEREAMSDIIDREILRPLGAYMGYDRENDKITLVLPRIPLSSDSTLTVDADNILVDVREDGTIVPSWDLSYDLSGLIGSVSYKAGPQGETVTINDNSHAAQLQEEFRGETKGVQFEARGVDPRRASFLQQVMAVRLSRGSKPNIRVNMSVDMTAWNSQLGDMWSVDYPEVPNLEDGTRGRTGILSEILETSISFDADENGEGMGAHVKAGLIAYVSRINIATIAPSAYVTSVSTNTATVRANEFTSSSSAGGLPTTDAGAFEVNDVCEIVNEDGTSAYAGRQTITGISGNDITFDGNFGGNLAANVIIRPTNWDNATSDQQGDHVHLGAKANNYILSGGGDLFYWADA